MLSDNITDVRGRGERWREGGGEWWDIRWAGEEEEEEEAENDEISDDILTICVFCYTTCTTSTCKIKPGGLWPIDAFLLHSYLCKSKVLAYLTHLSGSHSVAVVWSTHFRVAVGRCSFSSDTETTHVTSFLQLMSLYRRNNSSSESCSAPVVPVALEHETPGSKEGSPTHTTIQAVAAWQSAGTWRRQFCCSYCISKFSTNLNCTVQVKSNTSLVSVWLPVERGRAWGEGAEVAVEYSSGIA